MARVQRVVNLAARVVTDARQSARATPILAELGRKSVADLVTHRDHLAVHRALINPIAPEAVPALFVRRSAVSERVTRATSAGALEPPEFTLTFARRTFAYRAARSWNNLLLPSRVPEPIIGKIRKSFGISIMSVC